MSWGQKVLRLKCRVAKCHPKIVSPADFLSRSGAISGTTVLHRNASFSIVP